MVMPQMTGPQVAEGLRRTRPDMKIIFMSGYTDDRLIDRAAQFPDAAYLSKPFTADELLTRTRSLFDRSTDDPPAPS